LSFVTGGKSEWPGYPGWQPLAAGFDNDGHANPTVAEPESGHWHQTLRHL